MDTEKLLELAGHYLVLLIVVFAVLAVIRRTLGDIGFWPELAVVVVIAFLYRPAVKALGVEPEMWKRG